MRVVACQVPSIDELRVTQIISRYLQHMEQRGGEKRETLVETTHTEYLWKLAMLAQVVIDAVLYLGCLV